MLQYALVAFVAFAGAAPTLATAAAPATTQILQQRTDDGRTLLTDRPAPGATTERSWRLETEDPVAARRRALDVKVEAQLVSERIQRHLEQQRRADQEAERLRAARLDLARDRERDRAAFARDGLVADGVVLYAPRRLRAPPRWQWHHDPRVDRDRGDRDYHRGHPQGAPRPTRLTGSAAPESR